MKLAQERRADLHVLDQLGIRIQSLLRNGPRQLERDRAADRGVELDLLDRTVEIAGRIGHVQVGVGVQDRLDGVGAAAKVPQVLDREDDRTIVEDRLLTRGKIGDITRRIGAAFIPV